MRNTFQWEESKRLSSYDVHKGIGQWGIYHRRIGQWGITNRGIILWVMAQWVMAQWGIAQWGINHQRIVLCGIAPWGITQLGMAEWGITQSGMAQWEIAHREIVQWGIFLCGIAQSPNKGLPNEVSNNQLPPQKWGLNVEYFIIIIIFIINSTSKIYQGYAWLLPNSIRYHESRRLNNIDCWIFKLYDNN